MGRFSHWLASDKGIATLEYFGTLLLSPEILAAVFGERITKRVAEFFNGLSNRLSPSNAREVARWLTLNPIAAITFFVALAGGIVALVFEMRDPQVWKILDSDLPFFRWMAKSSYVLLFKPVLCFGVAVGIWITRSKPDREKFDAFLERHRIAVREAQKKRDLFQQLTVAIPYSVVLVGFFVGLALGNLLLLVLFQLLEKPLRAISYLAVEKRLRQLIAAFGLVMITAAYVIKIFH
jgi:hypothetical protein